MFIGLKIVDAAYDDIPVIIHLANAQLGKGYFNDSISSSLCNASEILLVVKDVYKEVIGFCYGYYKSKSEIQYKLRIKMSPDVLLGVPLMGVLETIVIKDGYKRHGIGRMLVQHLLSQFIEKNIRNIICIGWKSHEKVNIDNLMRYFKFDSVMEIKEYWKNDSLQKKYECPICGNPCLCSAILYYRSSVTDVL